MKFVLLLLLVPGVCLAKGLKIDIGKAGGKKSRVAFAKPMGASHLNLNMVQQMITSNLAHSTYFQVVVPPNLNTLSGALSAQTAKVLFKEGAEFLVAASTVKQGSRSVVQYKVYFLKDFKLIMDKTYLASKGQNQYVANVFSDDLIQVLTGKRSIFNTKFAVTSDRVGGGWKEVYVLDWNGQNMRAISSHRATVMSPKWSPGGKQVVYSAITFQPRKGVRSANLYIYDLFSRRRVRLSARPGINSGGAFFPDGRSLIMTLTQGGVPDLFRLGLNGKILDRLTKGPGRTMNVEGNVSPDGSKVVFSSDRKGKPMIYVMDLINKVPKRLTFAGRYNSEPSWSPDGKQIVFAGWVDKHFDVFVINVNGTGLRRLTQQRKPSGQWSNNISPSFSPDGRFVAFISDRSGKRQLYTMRLDGSHLRRVTDGRYNYFHVQWSPFLR